MSDEVKPVIELVESLKEYPHLQMKIVHLWGTPACRKYLLELLIPDTNKKRGFHARQGFPFDVINAIEDLKTAHDTTYPELAPKPTIWDGIKVTPDFGSKSE